MILRRVIEHFRKQEWTAIAIDFVIVVVGVFVGLQVNTWNEARIEQSTARDYIARIRDNLAENEADLAARIGYYQQVRKHALAALAAFDAPPTTLGGQFLIDAYQASQILPRSIGRDTYDEILSVGAVNTIPDIAIRRRLATFYNNIETLEATIKSITPYRERLRRDMPYAVQTAIRSACREALSIDAYGTPIAALPEECGVDLPPDEVAAAVAAVVNPELRKDLNRSLADLDVKLGLYEVVISRAKALDAFLEKAAP